MSDFLNKLDHLGVVVGKIIRKAMLTYSKAANEAFEIKDDKKLYEKYQKLDKGSLEKTAYGNELINRGYGSKKQ